MSILIPGFTRVYVPEMITVHLGLPDESAENVALPFTDYIKNVASSELYPTWPESALRANIYAIISIALNRVFTEWYRTKGYNFDITSSTQFDQSFVNGRGNYEPINKIVDEIFNSYIVREGQITPLFTTYCDGRTSQCQGMYQWGSVDLANQGYDPMEILEYYYGQDTTIVTDAPIGSVAPIYPGTPVKTGDSGIFVLLVKIALNRISNNFPAIKRILPLDQDFTPAMEESVREFQKIFNIEPTGIVDLGTWQRIRYTYSAVRKLAELSSKGIYLSEIIETFTEDLQDELVLPSTQLIQYFINILSTHYNTIPAVEINGRWTDETENSLMEFQKVSNLPVTGIVDEQTWKTMYSSASGILNNIPPTVLNLPRFLFPNLIYKKGSEGSGVYVLQQYLSYIALSFPEITAPKITGIFDDETEASVKAFQQTFNLNPDGIVERTTWETMARLYESLKASEIDLINSEPEL